MGDSATLLDGGAPATPDISIVIPVYNRADTIGRAIASCRAQSFATFEIIVVDDGSTDETLARVAAIADLRLQVVRHDVNRGGGAARNSGIDAARGRFVALLDSDDEWLPEKLARQHALLTAVDDPLAVAYAPILVQHGPGSSRYRRQRPIRTGESVLDYLCLSGATIQSSTLMLDSALARRVRFNPNLRHHQDYDFALRLQSAGARFLSDREPLSIWHNDARDGRVSRGHTADASLAWIESVRDAGSRRAVWAFQATMVAPLLPWHRLPRGLWYLLRAAALGAIGPMALTKALARIALPRQAYARLIAGLFRRRDGATGSPGHG